ncbi:MAG: hypothetical protein N2588_01355 [Rhodovarius sp.]|nr:hypothetical protein [Rhodovarius sp.]
MGAATAVVSAAAGGLPALAAGAAAAGCSAAFASALPDTEAGAAARDGSASPGGFAVVVEDLPCPLLRLAAALVAALGAGALASDVLLTLLLPAFAGLAAEADLTAVAAVRALAAAGTDALPAAGLVAVALPVALVGAVFSAGALLAALLAGVLLPLAGLVVAALAVSGLVVVFAAFALVAAAFAGAVLAAGFAVCVERVAARIDAPLLKAAPQPRATGSIRGGDAARRQAPFGLETLPARGGAPARPKRRPSPALACPRDPPRLQRRPAHGLRHGAADNGC